MKIHWHFGTKAVLGLGLFILMIAVLIVRMAQEDISLVEKDYYPKGQAYQELLDKVQNTVPYATDIHTRLENDMVIIAFPDFFRPESINGQVHFYHRVTDTRDIHTTLKLNSDGVFVYPAGDMKGRFILKIDWLQDGIAYYTEKNITIE
jgi:hypothetical protein